MNNLKVVNIRKCLKNIKLKKQYLNNLQNKLTKIKKLKNNNYQILNYNSLKFYLNYYNPIIKYIIKIVFSKTNTLLHIMDFEGNLIFFCSAGSMQYKGKRKKARYMVFRSFFKCIISKLKFLKSQPIALHLQNVQTNKIQLIRLLKKKLYIKIIKNFTIYPYNGCRKKKVQRKKFK
jgi:ribosomal protein S11